MYILYSKCRICFLMLLWRYIIIDFVFLKVLNSMVVWLLQQCETILWCVSSIGQLTFLLVFIQAYQSMLYWYWALLCIIFYVVRKFHCCMNQPLLLADFGTWSLCWCFGNTLACFWRSGPAGYRLKGKFWVCI